MQANVCMYCTACVMHGSKVVSGQNGHTIFLRTSYLHLRVMHLLESKLRVTGESKLKVLKGLIQHAPPPPLSHDIILYCFYVAKVHRLRNVIFVRNFINRPCIERLTVCSTIHVRQIGQLVIPLR